MTSFFTSRWVQAPSYATEVVDGGLPKGFRAAGVACGIKPDGTRDLGMVVSDSPATTSAARFTRSGTQSAPVLVSRQRADLRALRAVLVNSGNANAATGARGLDDAAKMQGGAAMIAGVSEQHVAVASTGVIGVPLPSDLIAKGTGALAHQLRPDGDSDFAEAIRTTDLFPKQVTLDVDALRGHGPDQRPGQGGGHDLAELRDAARVRPDRRQDGRGRGRPAAHASASSDRSTGSPSTASSRPRT